MRLSIAGTASSLAKTLRNTLCLWQRELQRFLEKNVGEVPEPYTSHRRFYGMYGYA